MLKLWPCFLLAAAIIALTNGPRFCDDQVEHVGYHEGETREQSHYTMSWLNLFFYPITTLVRGLGAKFRHIAVGEPFMVFALLGIFCRGLKSSFRVPLAAGMMVSFAMWFVPVELSSVLSTNWYWRAPFAVYAILMARLTLHYLCETRPRIRTLLFAAAIMKIVAMVVGFAPHWGKVERNGYLYLKVEPCRAPRN